MARQRKQKPAEPSLDELIAGGHKYQPLTYEPESVESVAMDRGLFTVAKDTGIEVANAAVGGVSAAANFLKPGNAASQWVDKNVIGTLEDSQSDAVKASKQKFRDEVAQADGVAGELAAVGRYIVDSPLQAAAQAAGSFLVPGAAVKAAGMAGRAAGLGAKGVQIAGRAGGVTAGTALAGGDAAGTAYELVKKAGGSEQDAVAAARSASVIPAVVGGVGGAFGAERLLAGGKGFAGGAASRAGKTALSEALQEGVEEGITQYEGQRAAVPFDPSIDPSKGVAAAAGMGAALGGMTGAGTSLLMGGHGNTGTTSPVDAIAQQLQSGEIAPDSVADSARQQSETAINDAVSESDGAEDVTDAVADAAQGPLTPQEKQEIARARMLARGDENPLNNLQLDVGAPTTAQEVQALAQQARERVDAQETEQIQRMLAEDEAALSKIEQARQATRDASEQESLAAQQQDLVQRSRDRVVDRLVQSYAPESGYFASRTLMAVDSQLQVLGEPALSKQERARVQAALDSAQAFIAPSLPVEKAAPVDAGADNSSMEARIPEKRGPANGAGQGFDPSTVQAQNWPQFVRERGQRVSDLRRGTPQWEELQAQWAQVKAAREAPTADPATGEISDEGRVQQIQERLEFLQQQGRAQGWSPQAVAQRDALQQELDLLSPAQRMEQLQAQADAADARAADWSGRQYRPNNQELPAYAAQGGPADIQEANEQRRLRNMSQAQQEAGAARDQARQLMDEGNALAQQAARGDEQPQQQTPVQQAYGSDGVVRALLESGDVELRDFGRALQDAAGDWAGMRKAVQAAALPAQVDVTGNLMHALGLAQQARQDRAPLHELVEGAAVDPLTMGMLRLLYSGTYMTRPHGREAVAQALRDYTQAAQALQPQPAAAGAVVAPRDILAALRGPITEQTDAASSRDKQSPAASGRGTTGGNAAGGRADGAGGAKRQPRADRAGQEPAEDGRGGRGQDAQDSERQPDRQVSEGAGKDRGGSVSQAALGNQGKVQKGKANTVEDASKDVAKKKPAELKQGEDLGITDEDVPFKRSGITDDGDGFDMAGFLSVMNQDQAALEAGKAQAVAKVQKVADAMRAAWANGPADVVVAYDMSDPRIPAAARRANEVQRSGGAAGDPEGFYHRGKVYLLASQLATTADAARVMAHESLGHHGLRGVFGQQMGSVLDQLAQARPAEVQAKLAEYGLIDTPANRRVAAEEVLAEMAEKTPQLGFVRRAVAAVRSWLRQNVPGMRNLKMTDAEVIQSYILPARAWVESGAGVEADKDGVGFSRSDASAEAFVRAPDGSIDYGSITPEIGRSMRRQAAPIRLREGDAATGLRHIERGVRLAQIRAAGYASIPDFVSEVAQNYDAIHRGRGASLFLVKKEAKPNRTLVVKLETGKDGEFYDVKTAMVTRPDFMRGKEVLWERAQTNRSVSETPSAISGQSTEKTLTQDGEDEQDTMFSRSRLANLKDSALSRLDSILSHPGKVSLWDKTVGTMRHLGERSPAFKKVYDAAQQNIDDVSMLANDAANAAPRILPRVDSLRDVLGKSRKRPVSAADNKAIAAPLFEGTLVWTRDAHGKPAKVDELTQRYASFTAHDKADMLLNMGRIDPKVLGMWRAMPMPQFEKAIDSRFNSKVLKAGMVWSDSELKNQFKLSADQISLYREARAAIDRSIDMTARTDMLRALGEGYANLRDVVLDQPTMEGAAQLLLDTLESEAKAQPDSRERLADLMQTIGKRLEQATELQQQGYAPLMRFGRYTVDVVDAGGERQFFGMYETQRESNQAKVQLAQEFKGASISQGTMSKDAFNLFAGVTPESLELFGNMLGLNSEGDGAKDRAFQEYLKLTKNNHSALKRLIHRKGTAGFSEDVGRTVASFVYSNARQGAAGLNVGTMDKAINDIPKEQGELKDLAMGLRSYIQDPQEEGNAVRGMLFAQYLGGSVASALVNMTQPFQVTLPWLSQFGGMKKAGAQLARAVNDMRRSWMEEGFSYEPDLARALKAAEDDGTVSPQEIHQLMAQSRGAGTLRSGDGTRAGDLRAQAGNAWEKTKVLWGQPFAIAEQFNRRSTFIASYRLAKQQGMQNPAEFARKAVLETQFVYSKANKPQWARGTIGGTLFTFKTYSVSYLELMQRMWTQGGPEGKRAVAWSTAMLMLMSGAGGLPFLEDVEDLIDTAGQMMGYSMSTKQWRKQLLTDAVGKEFADFLEQGLSGLPGAPIDVSGRLGMPNLIPGTGLALEKPDRSRDLLEILGPAGDLIKRGFTGGMDVARGVLTGDAAAVGRGALEVMPTAVRNLAKGYDMAASGTYKDSKGRKVIDVSLDEAVAKAIGFQPKNVAEVQEATGLEQNLIGQNRAMKARLAADMAQAVYDRDPVEQNAVRQRLRDWNRRNPESPLTIDMNAVRRRVFKMRQTKAERVAAAAPKQIRASVRKALSDGE